MDWTHLKLSDRPLLTVTTKDPFETSSDRLEELLRSIPSPDSGAVEGLQDGDASSVHPV